MKSLKVLIQAIALSSLLALGACTKTVYRDKEVFVAPPAEYLQDCKVYGIEGPLVLHALEQSRKNRLSLEQCNVDKKSLRDWSEATKKTFD